jgi:hypothetical protein
VLDVEARADVRWRRDTPIVDGSARRVRVRRARAGHHSNLHRGFSNSANADCGACFRECQSALPARAHDGEHLRRDSELPRARVDLSG